MSKRKHRIFCSTWTAVILSVLVMGEPAYAGSLNANEQELMGIIRGTYTYQGVTYRVKAEYIRVAENYLLQDDVDCTDEQKQKAINRMFSSIQQGIDEGYLEPAFPQAVSGSSGGESENAGNGEADRANDSAGNASAGGAEAHESGTNDAESETSGDGDGSGGQSAETGEGAGTVSAGMTSETEETKHPILESLEAYAKRPLETLLSGSVQDGQALGAEAAHAVPEEHLSETGGTEQETGMETPESGAWETEQEDAKETSGLIQAEQTGGGFTGDSGKAAGGQETRAENSATMFYEKLTHAAWAVCGGMILGMAGLFAVSIRKHLLIIHHVRHAGRKRGRPG